MILDEDFFIIIFSILSGVPIGIVLSMLIEEIKNNDKDK